MRYPVRRTAKLWRALALAAFVFGFFGGSPASAQEREQERDRRYSFVFSGTRLSDALNILIDDTEINLIFETDMVAGQTSFCRASQELIDRVLKCILRGTGLDYILLSSGTYIIVRSVRGETQFGAVAGSVLDLESGEPIENANIILSTGNVGTASNRSGRFVFTSVAPGLHIMTVSHVAYGSRVDTVIVSPNEEEKLLISLEKRAFLADALVITDSEARPSSVRRGSDVIQDIELLDLNPLASINVLQTLDLIEGIHQGESLSAIHMQGSDSGEHIYRLDGVPVFIPVKLGGLIGPFSPFAVSEIRIRKAGFGASHGSQLAGIVDIKQQIAPPSRRRVEVLIDPVSLNARVSGRSGDPSGFRASWTIAARQDLQYSPYFKQIDDIMQSWSQPDFFLLDLLRKESGLDELDPAIKEIIRSERNDFNVGFSDVHAAVRLNFGLFHTIQASIYRNRNLFGENQDSLGELIPNEPSSEDRFKWENTVLQVRYEGILSGRLLADASFWLSGYRLLDTFGDFPLGLTPDSLCDSSCAEPVLTDDFNEVNEIGISAGASYALSLRHSALARIEVVKSENDFTITLSPFLNSISSSGTRKPNGWRIGGFVEEIWSLGTATTLRSGLRFTYLPEQQSVYAEPRFSINYDESVRSTGFLAASISAGLYRQFTHQVDVSTYNINALFPSVRFWFPLDRRENPPKALHLAGKIVIQPSVNWSFTAGTYFKHQPHLLVLNYGDHVSARTTGSGTLKIPLMQKASGNAAGFSIAANHRSRRHSLTIRYEYGHATRRIRNRFKNSRLVVPWNIPHSVFSLLEIVPSNQVVLSIRGHAMFGRAWGFRSAYYDYVEPSSISSQFGSFDFSTPESHEMSEFIQFDAGITYSAPVGAVDLQVRIYAINILGRRNVRDWSLVEREPRGAFELATRSGIPFLPMLSIRLGV